MQRPDPALRVDAVSVSFGGVRALSHVSLEILPGEAVGIIGPNGAGKTTLLNVVSGLVRTTTGRVELRGVDVTGFGTARRARAGLGRTFQTPQLPGPLTVGQILDTVARQTARAEREDHRRVGTDQVLELVGISELRDTTADRLEAGQRRFVDLARVLMLAPSVVMLDEPATGLRTGEVDQLVTVINDARDEQGIAFGIVSHDMPLVHRTCSEAVVLDRGEHLVTAPPTEVREHEAVVAAYFGSEAGAW